MNLTLRVDSSGEKLQIVCTVKSNRINMKQWAVCLQLVVDQAKVLLVFVLIWYKYKVWLETDIGKGHLTNIKFEEF